MGHGRTLISVEDEDAQSDIYHKIISENLSVRETEAIVKKYQKSLNPKQAKQVANSAFNISESEKSDVSSKLGSKIDVSVAANGKGKITIPFKSEADYLRIIQLIKG